MQLQERLRQREKKAKLAAKSKLSFGEEGDEQEDEEEEAAVRQLLVTLSVPAMARPIAREIFWLQQ